jgi:NAD(P)-dependent dehydrogenase (short-subunit alcohol dehydrogenase family)
MTTVGIATGGARGMGLECARRMLDLVDVVLLVDRDEAGVAAAAAELAASGANVEPAVADVTDQNALARLADPSARLGTLRAVAHAAGVSPTMADWRAMFAVDLVGTARLAEALRPLATAGTALVCFASMAPVLGIR